MSGYPHGVAQATRTDPLRVLEEIKRQSLEALGGLPGTLYGPVEDALKVALLKGDGKTNHYEEQAALWVLRQHQATHVMKYRQQVAQAFDDFRALRIRSGGDVTLRLVDEQQLEYELASGRLNEALVARFARPLDTLQTRLQALSEVMRVPAGINPIGPERLVQAFSQTLLDAQVPDTLRGRLFRHYETDLIRLLGDLYARINALLASSGYGAPMAPRAPQDDFRRETAPPVSGYSGTPGAFHDGYGGGGGYVPGPGIGAEPVGRGSAPPMSQHDVAAMAQELAQLRSQLHAWRESIHRGDVASSGSGVHAPDRPVMQRREMRVDEILSVASLLQAEPPDAFARALAVTGRLGETIRDHLQDGARRLGLNPDQACFSPEEEDAIDLVAMLFDSLFRHNALQDRARRLYARLVLPYVKVALTDNAVFVKREHPARRLLDAITEACEGNDGETPQDRELLDRATEVSQRVVADYNEDLAVFELAHAELDALLAQQRRRFELQEQRAAKATYGRERLGAARAQAESALEERLGDGEVTLTQAVADFLAMPWRHHVVQTLLRDNADPRRHAEAIALGDALVMADRLAEQNRGAELADQLLALQPSIIECLASSGLDDSAAQHGMAGLVRALATPDTPRRHSEAPSLSMPEDDAGEAERRLWLAGGTDTIRQDPLLAERIRSLETGDWLRLTNAEGETTAVKIAWLSPLTSRYLLVNRRGLRVLVASAEELSALASVGRLTIGAERTAFDEAMRQVRRHLDRGTGTR